MSPAALMARGHWQTILPALGVDARYLKNQHGPCPICNGKDRFRWDDQNSLGGYICSQCGAGDGFDLAKKVTGMSFRDIADKISMMLGKPKDYIPPKVDQEEAKNRDAMKRIWSGSQRPQEGGAVSSYLIRRVGCLWPSNSIREHTNVWTEGGFHHAMVAKIITHDDKAVNIHQTYLTKDGQKANVGTAKKVMSGKLPDGCAIRLGPAAPVMGVAEGIESAISASILFDMPVWACINGGLLSKWVPPEIAEEIFIFGDADENYTGEAKAYTLANRLVTQFKRKVSVLFPEEVGKDFNDIHRDMMFSREVPESHLRVIK
jgi:putative DNA primase/helicase